MLEIELELVHVGVAILSADYLKVKKFTDQLLFNTTRIEVYKDDKLESFRIF